MEKVNSEDEARVVVALVEVVSGFDVSNSNEASTIEDSVALLGVTTVETIVPLLNGSRVNKVLLSDACTVRKKLSSSLSELVAGKTVLELYPHSHRPHCPGMKSP